MVFKVDWEKTDSRFSVPEASIVTMLHLAYPNETLESFEIISGGCSNLNYRINLANATAPVLLRIYMHDNKAASREQKIGQLLCDAVPVPQINYIGHSGGHDFAISEFIPGITLRDLLLQKKSYDMHAIMFEVGSALAQIAQHSFACAGLFDENLKVESTFSRESDVHLINEYLTNKFVLKALTPETVFKIEKILHQHIDLLSSNNSATLVHGDFDPANILVDCNNGQWHITAILDWEFVFSGSILRDVSNMLRYAHQASPVFEDAFLQGMRAGGVELPDNWRLSIQLLNLMSLLDCLSRFDPITQPNRLKDIQQLIENILSSINSI